MIKLSVENEKGERLSLSPSSQYSVLKIDGLTPPTATVNTSILALNDGAKVNSARVEPRDIIITLKPRFPIGLNRTKLYRYFQIKRNVRMFFKTAYNDVYIDGIVKAIDGDLFAQSQKIVITIFCADPYFKDVKESVILMSQTIDLFEFPFDISSVGKEFSKIDNLKTVNVVNNGDVTSGMIIELSANSEVVNPIIYDRVSTKAMAFEITLAATQSLIINTNQNEKSVFLNVGAEKINAISTLNRGSNWLQLTPGDNIFVYEASSGAENLEITFSHTDRYGGL